MRSLTLPGIHCLALLSTLALFACLNCFCPEASLAQESEAALEVVVAEEAVPPTTSEQPDLSISLNGALGGLVGITAGCDCFNDWWSMVIGACAGAIVVAGVRLLDHLRIDDPVGAWPVHGLCGIWGCLAIGFIPNTHLASGATSLWVQSVGTFAIVAWAFVSMLGVFGILKACGILRVSAEDELAGLDVSEHGMTAYPVEMPGMMGMPLGSPSRGYPVPATQPGGSAPAVVAGLKADTNK